MCFPRSNFAVTLVASPPEDAFIDLTANSILGVLKLSIAVKIGSYLRQCQQIYSFPYQSSH